MTCQQLADRLDKSREGVRKAILRLGIKPRHHFGGVSYYDPATTLPLLQQEIRNYTRKTPASA